MTRSNGNCAVINNSFANGYYLILPLAVSVNTNEENKEKTMGTRPFEFRENQSGGNLLFACFLIFTFASKRSIRSVDKNRIKYRSGWQLSRLA